MHPSVGAGTLSIEKIQSCVASYYEVTVDELVSPSRAARVAWPRQVAIHLTRELTTASLQGIGDAFGGRNHATVLHACKRVSQRMMETPETTNDIRELTATIARGEADRDC
jgi:chromosomal replication initiator protein